MTACEMLKTKYQERVSHTNARELRSLEYAAQSKKLTVPEYRFLCLEITSGDIRKNGDYCGDLFADIQRLHEAKLMASNAHLNGHGKVTSYWLTKKGVKKLAAELGLK